MSSHDGLPSSRRCGGPAIGLALHRAGIQAVVYESSAGAARRRGWLFESGAERASPYCRALGVEHVMDGLGFRNDRLIFHNEAGRVIAEAPVGRRDRVAWLVQPCPARGSHRRGRPLEFGSALVSVESQRDV